MREAQYRGYCTYREKDNWIYGVPVKYHDGDWQITQEFYAVTVDPESIGEYIGIEDINGKKVYEHDIVKFRRINALGYTNERIGEVLYYDKLPIFYIMSTTGDAWDWCDCENIEVIGNSYENKELLEKKPWS